MSYKSSEAKDEMLSECRAYYRNNREELISIDKFERNYCSIDAIEWYTKSCFLYRIINKALRTEDTACPKSPLGISFLNISTISLNFINNFFFKL
jgi:hypothetical protein